MIIHNEQLVVFFCCQTFLDTLIFNACTQEQCGNEELTHAHIVSPQLSALAFFLRMRILKYLLS